jgi:hypothetical protein
VDVIADGGLAAEDDARAEHRRAGDPGLSDEEAVGADLDVVADLDEVVDLGSASDARGGELGAVDADTRPDLDVVLDDHRADLRDLRVLLAVPAVAEAVGADNGARVDDDAVADRAAFADHDVGEELAVVADGRVVADVDAGVEDGAGAERDAFADEGVGADGDAGGEAGGGGDAGGGVDALGQAWDGRGEQLEDAGEREVGVVDDQDGPFVVRGELDALLDEDGGGAGGGEILEKLVGAEEGDVGGRRLGEHGGAGNAQVGGAGRRLDIQELGDFGEGGHRNKG